MKTYFSKLLAVLIWVAVLASCSCWADEAQDGTKLARDLEKKVQQLDELVRTWSDGRSRLMIERSANASPSGLAVRRLDWASLPLIRICPVSKLFKTKLGGFGMGTPMAAVTVLESGEKFGPEVYLLFVPDPIKDKPQKAVLVAISPFQYGRLGFVKRAELERIDQPFSTIGPLPVAGARFDGQDVVLRLRWDAETWQFKFTPELMFR